MKKMNDGGGLDLKIIDSGRCGKKSYWKITEDNTLVIYGSGAAYDESFQFSNPKPWNIYEKVIEKVIVEDEITMIGDYSFHCFELLSQVILPNGLLEIGAYSFARCENLRTIEIPDSVTKIYDGAFFNCTSLYDINDISRVPYIGISCFYGTKIARCKYEMD